ncbi:MAG: RAD55 family ATPase [Haloferacaceae archaeon]
MADSGDDYSIGDVLPIEGLDAVPQGTNLLVSGPAMTGKRDVVVDLLAAGQAHGDRSLVITTDTPANRIRAAYESVGGRVEPSYLQTIDASGSGGSAGNEGVQLVSSPSDLTGIGIAFTKAVDRMDDADRVRLGFLSISTLLQYVDQERAFAFFHVLTQRASAAGYFGAFAIDPSMHEDRLVNVMASVFDGVVELREGTSGTREVRVRGIAGVASEWHEFPQ